MVLDPISALNVAAAVVQFIDFGSKLISKRQEILKSVDGRLIEHIHVRAAAVRLTEQCKTLRSHVDPKDFKKDPVPGEEGLADILSRCVRLAEDLLQTVDQLRVTGVGKQFKSFRSAFKSLWSKDKIERMLVDLQSLRAELMMSLLIVMREERSIEVQKLMDANKSLESTILTNLRQTAASHQQQINDLHQAVASSWFFREDKKAKIKAANEWLLKNQSLVLKLNENVNQTTTVTTDNQIRNRIRDSLCFNEIFQRFSEIPDAQARTFNWIYDLDESRSSQWTSFGQWLQKPQVGNSKLYWISGKPGSGKSTLLRYLCKNSNTKDYLRTWANSTDVLLASCFFWNPGTVLQKSQQGLLRTLLYQLLVEESDFTGFLFPMRWQLWELGSEFQYAWSDEELISAIFAFVDYYGKQQKIAIFVDGLDEYQGTEEERHDICTMLLKLAQHDSVKICVSSRPWNVYADAFRPNPKLRLEDLTKGDIQNFVDDQLSSNEFYRQWSQDQPEQSQNLRRDTVYKAQGVFLWVRLVINNLLRGLRANDDAYDLSRRLAELPAELEDYFQRMVDGLDKFYLEDAARMFALAHTGNHMLMTYYYTHSVSVEQCLSGKEDEHSHDDIVRLESIEDRRINARCMGLLESFRSSEYPGLRVVDFLHRTAQDYMLSPIMKQKMKTWQANPTDVVMVELISSVCQMKSCDLDQPWMDFRRYRKLLMASIQDIRDVYDSSNETHQSLIREIESAFYRLRKRRSLNEKGSVTDPSDVDNSIPWGQEHEIQKTNFLAWTISYGFDTYALEIMTNWTISNLNDKESRPYLDYAIRPLLGERGPNKHSLPDMGHYRIFKRLLALGADPNQVWRNNTVWGHYLEGLGDIAGVQQIVRETRMIPKSPAFTIMKTMIEDGAIDTVRIGSGKHYAGTRYSKFVRTVSPWDVARNTFKAAEAAELIDLLNKSPHGTLAAKANRVIARLN